MNAGPTVTTDVSRAADCLRCGGVIAIPTDTVYGIAAALDNPTAIERIYQIKGRALDKAIPILVGDPEQLDRLGRCIASDARRLVGRFWPGPLTIVVEASLAVPAVVLRGGSTVGLRMPDSALALAIIRSSGGALAVTSANRSGQPEARSAEDVIRFLGDEVDVVVDGGPAPVGVASTVVDMTVNPPAIVRAGALGRDEIESALTKAGD